LPCDAGNVVAEIPNEHEELFLRALAWLGETYGERIFYVERDIVFTLQARLRQAVAELGDMARVYNDYPMLPGPRRSLSADLVVLAPDGHVAVAAEFKYEPCHNRLDVLKNKLPVTVWTDIVKDTARCAEFVAAAKADVAYAVCIDEGGYLARRDLSVWADCRRWSSEPYMTTRLTYLSPQAAAA
jgi:hypothetical protein